MTSQEIRQQFIDFFVQKHGHTFVPSSPVVPHDDPTLLFTNAGMNQFKPIFLGQEKRAYTRAVNTQKCIRAGGKHNDLDDVGRSRRHHTFFEMLGNWSFGDYFKRGAIEMSWELLTKVWKLDPTRLHVTVHAGDEAIGVPRDDEAAQIWRDIGVSDDRIHYGNTKDNFWEMGETGPCGPCTEIFVDRTPDKSGGPSVLSGEDPRVMEIWNNVFIQYNRNADKTLTPLPAQHVDTGMGLERIIQVLQGKDDNYAIDLFDPFWAKLKELSGITYGGKYPKSNSADPVAEAADAGLRHDIAFRVIGDHIRCLTFALTDGAVPNNEGRGYVLRRILRRAVRFGRQQLELKEPFLHKLVPVVVEAMGDAFPELKKNPARVTEFIRDEEVSFGRTLDRGIELFDEASSHAVGEAYAVAKGLTYVGMSRSSTVRGDWKTGGGTEVQASVALDFADSKDFARKIDLFAGLRELKSLGKAAVIPAGDAFKLHDTFGFPIDLTRIMAEERGMSVDIAGYEKLMEQAKELARSGGRDEASAVITLPPAAIAELEKLGIGPTDDSIKFKDLIAGVRILAAWNGAEFVQEVAAGQEVALILDRTNFYAEMGGQVGDAGQIYLPDQKSEFFNVRTTKKSGPYVLHIGTAEKSFRITGQNTEAYVGDGRKPTEQNHTTTHLANWALRETLGEDVQQKGSLVDPEKLRFDFSHGKSLTDDELANVESLVQASIKACHTVYAEEAPQEQALKINGLRAVFGEKYPPKVRVVSIGVPVKDLLANPTNPEWRKYSIEFCGGTHLSGSGDPGRFAIIAEESVSKGVRRIVGVTGLNASYAYIAESDVSRVLKMADERGDGDLSGVLKMLQRVLMLPNLPLRSKRRGQAAMAELQAKQRTWEKANKSTASGSKIDASAIAADLITKAQQIAGGALIVAEITGANDDALRSTIDSIKKRSPSFGAMLAAVNDGKISFVAAVSDDLIAKGLKSGDWIRETAKMAGGGGGGRPQMAQAGGKDPAKLPDALARAKEFAVGILA